MLAEVSQYVDCCSLLSQVGEAENLIKTRTQLGKTDKFTNIDILIPTTYMKALHEEVVTILCI